MELQLISASSSAGNPVDCTLIYPLDDKAHGLPVVDETYPWAGKTISALRDRLMIEWVMSFPESMRLYKRMVDGITMAIREWKDSGSKPSAYSRPSVVRVGIVCSNGSQLSPCFVEKLYDHFVSGPVIVRGLQVSRHHRDALKGAWGHSEDIVWQVSYVSVHHDVLRRFDQLFDPKMWLNFDPTANSESERQFQKDPFNSHVSFTDMVLDFECGTAYNHQQRKTHYIRCTYASHSKTNCWFLSSSGYKSACRSFRAAGIQPYSVHPLTGEAVFLLGRITYGTVDWCDFGGMKSSRLRRETPRMTAARECCEETLGILGSTEELSAALADFKTNNCFKVLNVDTQYVGHFMRIPYRDYPRVFDKELRKTYSVIEVDEMKWFSLSSMKSAVVMANCDSEQYDATQRGHGITAKALQQDGTVDDSCSHRLRAPFVSSLCIADALGILDSIAAIAKKHHAARDSAKVPYMSVPAPREARSDFNTESAGAGDSICSRKTCTKASASANLHVNYSKAATFSAGQNSFEQCVACISLDQNSESSSSTESECDWTRNDGKGDFCRSSDWPDPSWDKTVPEKNTSGVSEAGHVSLNVRKDSELRKQESPKSSHVKDKPVDITSSVRTHGKSRKRGNHHHRVKSRDRHTDSQAHSLKHETRKHRHGLLLYGMGAGSTTVLESYMNL